MKESYFIACRKRITASFAWTTIQKDLCSLLQAKTFTYKNNKHIFITFFFYSYSDKGKSVWWRYEECCCWFWASWLEFSRTCQSSVLYQIHATRSESDLKWWMGFECRNMGYTIEKQRCYYLRTKYQWWFPWLSWWTHSHWILQKRTSIIIVGFQDEKAIPINWLESWTLCITNICVFHSIQVILTLKSIHVSCIFLLNLFLVNSIRNHLLQEVVDKMSSWCMTRKTTINHLQE